VGEKVICRSCGAENDETVDFCKNCGEYLRWELTRTLPAAIQVQGETPPPVPAVTPGALSGGSGAATTETELPSGGFPAPGPAPDTESLPAVEGRPLDGAAAEAGYEPVTGYEPDTSYESVAGYEAGAGHEPGGRHEPGAGYEPGGRHEPGAGHEPGAAGAPSAGGMAATEPLPAVSADDEVMHDGATAVNTAVLESSLPDEFVPVAADRPELPVTGGATLVSIKAGPDELGPTDLAIADVAPGGDVWFEFLLRNASRIVDNYDVVVAGLPDGWATVAPETAYLVPFGSGGTSEQRVRVRIAPPRVSESEAREWHFELIALSRANGGIAARTPAVVVVLPFNAWEVETEPLMRTGRRRGHYMVTLANRGNTPLDLWLYATNPEGRLKGRFAEPMLPLSAAEARTTRLELRPLRPKIFGRTIEHRAAIEALPDEPEPVDPPLPFRKRAKESLKGMFSPGSASLGPQGVRFTKPRAKMPRPPTKQLRLEDLKRKQNHGPVGPLAPSQVVFRQKAMIPTWFILLALLIAALIVLFLLTRNHQVRVPMLKGQTAFSAQQKLSAHHLNLNPSIQQTATSNPSLVGKVVNQDPAPGTKVNKGTQVSIEVAVGNGKTTVPKVTGTRAQADTELLNKHLTLGAVEPVTAPMNWIVASQLPAPGVQVPNGTPVQVFLKAPPKKKKKSTTTGAAGGGPGSATGGTGGAAGVAEVVVPPINNRKESAYAAAVTAAGLNPSEAVLPSVSTAKVGSLVVSPPPGAKVPKGTTVSISISGGTPDLAFDERTSVHLVNSSTTKALHVAKSPDPVSMEPSFSPNGKEFVFRSDTRVFLAPTSNPKKAIAIYQGPDLYTNVTFAPDKHRRVLALVRSVEKIGTLCLGSIRQNALTAQCLGFDGWSLGRSVSWSPDGRTILVFGSDPQDNSRFGIVRFTTKKPFSTNPADWHGAMATNVTVPGRGVIAAAFGPSGQDVAVVSNLSSSFFRVTLVTPGDLDPTQFPSWSFRACAVAWRPDNVKVAVVESDALCKNPIGAVVQVVPGQPRSSALVLAPNGENPVYQPFSVSGKG
jgi:beta-lactam-binding protein with PASTA domain